MRSGVIVLGFFLSSEGCGFSSPAAGDNDLPDGGTCPSAFAKQVDTCQLAFGGDLMLSGSKLAYDTGTHVLTVGGTPMAVPHMTLTTKVGSVDVIFGHNVRIMGNATLRATGMLPFGIIASGSVTLEDGAQIDVSDGGAGALATCSSSPTPGGDDTGGGGGGGGAGYAAAGGDGGPGNSDGPGAPGGMKSGSIAMPAGPVGGCPGAHGGAGGAPGGDGGAGGGALYIAAADRIELLGMDANGAVLTAGGGGGHGGMQGGGGAGGGGGGSGGMIWLEAPHVLGANGLVAANGGGGGEGSEGGKAGHDGAPGTLTTSRASGGTGSAPEGADGGLGGSKEDPTGETVTAQLKAGGGGGGGGVGYIHFESGDVQLGSISPAAQ